MGVLLPASRQAVLDWAKLAALGGDPEAGFEQSFASLAYQYIADKAPRLLDYMVGFQLLDRNEDNTKAAGIFGFKLGDQWVYAPVFFLAGDLKGHELLYLKEQDVFVPLKENWINYLLNRRPLVLGEGRSETRSQFGIRQPDLRSMSQPPQSMKYSFDLSKPYAWAKEVMPVWAATATKNPAKLTKFANLQKDLDLRTWLPQDMELICAAVEACGKYPLFKKAMDEFYGPELLQQCLKTLRDNIVKQSSILRLTPAPPQPHTGVLLPKLKPAKKLAMWKNGSERLNQMKFSDKDRERLIREGYLIHDKRAEEELSRAIRQSSEISLSNPDDSNVYETLNSDGKFQKTLILHNPHTHNGRLNQLVVIDTETPRAWLNADRNAVWTKSQFSREEYNTWLDKLPVADSLSADTTYVVVTKSGQGSTPFKVYESLGDGLYDVYFKDSISYKSRRPEYLPDRGGRPDDYSSNRQLVQLKNKLGSALHSSCNVLYVPEDAKLITIKEPDDCCGQSSDPPTLELGSVADVQRLLIEKTSSLKVIPDSNELVINNKRMTRLDGLFHLVGDYGFSEKLAKEIIQEADRSFGVRLRVKKANPWAAGEGLSSPQFDEPAYGQEEEFANAQMQYPYADAQQIPELSSSNTDPSVYDPNTQPDPGAMQAAQQAGQMGQKEVFDAASFAGLVRNNRSNSVIDKAVPVLMKTLDQLGRLMFSFFYNGPEWEDRFGKSDIPDLEDALRNAFESVGDVTLWLKERTIDADPGATLGAPSIQDVAR